MWRTLFLIVPLVLAGCASGPAKLPIDTSYTALDQNSRVDYIVLHYTGTTTPAALHRLTSGGVSAHYLVSDEPMPRIYRLVPEDRRAWHAGQSAWAGRTWLNADSIGIEIVNPGPGAAAGGITRWAPYPAAQIHLLVRLIKDIMARQGIPARNVLGHSDIAPQRKTDPGPAFPWKQLFDAGIGQWYDPVRAQTARQRFDILGVPEARWFQAELTRVGYAVPQTAEFDKETRNVIAAFQMHFRPSRADGVADNETAAILAAMPSEPGWQAPRAGGAESPHSPPSSRAARP